MLNIGPGEMLLIFVIALIVFGPGRLPEVARSMGKAVREFRKASSNVQRVWDEVTREAPQGQPQPPRTGPQATGAAPPERQTAAAAPEADQGKPETAQSGQEQEKGEAGQVSENPEDPFRQKHPQTKDALQQEIAGTK